MKRAWAVLIMILMAQSRSQSMTVLPMNLEQMTRDSASILHAKVIGIREETDELLKIPVSVITLQPEECLKGENAQRVQFRQVKGMGLPSYRVGEEIVIFLYPQSKARVTSPVGGVQGLFKVIVTQEGKVVKNLYPHILSQENSVAMNDKSRTPRLLPLDSLKGRIREAVSRREWSVR